MGHGRISRRRRGNHRDVREPGRRRSRWHWVLWLGAAPVAVVTATSVLPATGAGALPWPVRNAVSASVTLGNGPAATAYPYRAGPALALDAYGFVVGQCTSFVAWWLNARGLPLAVVTVGAAGTGLFLNASTWDDAARAAGYRSGHVPVVGAIAQWHSGEASGRRDADGTWHTIAAGGPGHVAVVVRVLPDGQAEWLDYGFGGKAVLHRGSGYAPRYLYLGVTPPPVSPAVS